MTLQLRNEPNLPPNDHEMMVYHTMAKHAVQSKFYRGLGDEPAVMMIMLSARELGVPPMAALNGGINIIQGKVEISARIMSAMIRRAGHSIQVIEETPTSCTIRGVRADNKDTETTTFTIDDAKQAGIFKAGGGWTKWPKDMCFARALSRLARRLFSDVIGTAYIEGEIVDSPCKPNRDDETQVIDSQPVTKTTDLSSEYLDCLNHDEYAQEYLETVQKYFDWTPIIALRELLKDKESLVRKFIAWKQKNKSGVENAT